MACPTNWLQIYFILKIKLFSISKWVGLWWSIFNLKGATNKHPVLPCMWDISNGCLVEFPLFWKGWFIAAVPHIIQPFHFLKLISPSFNSISTANILKKFPSLRFNQLATFSVEFYLYTLLSFSDDTLCGDPEQPLSSIVNQTSPTTVEYTCLKGYKMTGGGDRTRTCSPKGVWEGRPPMCSGQTAFLPFDFIYTHLCNTINRNTMNDHRSCIFGANMSRAKSVCGST